MKVLGFLLRNWRVTLLAALLTAGAGYVAVLTHQRDVARRERDAVADTLINTYATMDTLRQLNDTLHEQLAFQAARVTSLVADSQRTGRLLATISVEAQRWQAIATKLTKQRGDTTETADSIVAGPITARATVLLVPPMATWRWDVTQAPFDLTIGVACQAGPAGRMAPVTDIAGPTWFKPSNLRVTAAVTVCNPPVLRQRSVVKTALVVTGVVLFIEHVLFPLTH